jgi:hypothetical protein
MRRPFWFCKLHRQPFVQLVGQGFARGRKRCLEGTRIKVCPVCHQAAIDRCNVERGHDRNRKLASVFD